MIFLPSNVISLCQYVDQSVSETTKKKYQSILLQSLVEAVSEGGEILENLKEMNLKDVVC